MYTTISKCRICGNTNLVSLINLGEQALTGVFPKNKSEKITSGPLELVKCHPLNSDDDVCHLVQLRHSYDLSEMYGVNYGYRSGLNQSMVQHLKDIVKYIKTIIDFKKDDLVIDIGSNDSTTLQQYPSNLTLAGVDPTGIKFKQYYPKHIDLIPDFFSYENVKKKFPGKKAKVITSIAMFYDLENPIAFVKDIYDSLADDGIWVFEQSYLPLMLEVNAYDTICHEHLEYYSLCQIKWMMEKVGFKIIDVELNDINGGSFRITVAKQKSKYQANASVAKIEKKENQLKFKSLTPYEEFKQNVLKHKKELSELIVNLNQQGKKIFGYGASTKGNVILQYCGLTTNEIPFIAEVNEDKFGSFTPFTHIPIISEKEARKMKLDYFLVLPWHFREGILKKEKEFLRAGGKFIFPLPKIEIFG
ncbi:MAG: methyltransferase domain-containing protein [Bacteroidetes bacterium]|nr:methyltransferase domain-containing protein [Bacteroidota bacterium]